MPRLQKTLTQTKRLHGKNTKQCTTIAQLKGLTVSELRHICNDRDLKKYKKLRKHDLIMFVWKNVYKGDNKKYVDAPVHKKQKIKTIYQKHSGSLSNCLTVAQLNARSKYDLKLLFKQHNYNYKNLKKSEMVDFLWNNLYKGPKDSLLLPFDHTKYIPIENKFKIKLSNKVIKYAKELLQNICKSNLNKIDFGINITLFTATVILLTNCTTDNIQTLAKKTLKHMTRYAIELAEKEQYFDNIVTALELVVSCKNRVNMSISANSLWASFNEVTEECNNIKDWLYFLGYDSKREQTELTKTWITLSKNKKYSAKLFNIWGTVTVVQSWACRLHVLVYLDNTHKSNNISARSKKNIDIFCKYLQNNWFPHIPQTYNILSANRKSTVSADLAYNKYKLMINPTHYHTTIVATYTGHIAIGSNISLNPKWILTLIKELETDLNEFKKNVKKLIKGNSLRPAQTESLRLLENITYVGTCIGILLISYQTNHKKFGAIKAHYTKWTSCRKDMLQLLDKTIANDLFINKKWKISKFDLINKQFLVSQKHGILEWRKHILVGTWLNWWVFK